MVKPFPILFPLAAKHLPIPNFLHSTNFKIVDTMPLKGLFLHYDESGLALCKAGEKGRVRVDFVSGAAYHRRRQGGGELIAKAVNYRSAPIVWDATGGLGRDAFVLIGLGLSVRVFEQNPVVFALLDDGVSRAKGDLQTAPLMQNIILHHANAVEIWPHLQQQYEQPDVIFLDPMYPERQKSAAVKKEMAYFHELFENNIQDEAMLLKAARIYAKKRVVVKRPRLGALLNNEAPAYQYIGKSTRFDVYLPF